MDVRDIKEEPEDSEYPSAEDQFIDCDIVKEEYEIQDASECFVEKYVDNLPIFQFLKSLLFFMLRKLPAQIEGAVRNIVSYEITEYPKAESEEKKFKCSVCARTFAKSSYLGAHFRSHNPHKPYKCNICEKNFTLASLLQKHITSHFSQRTVPCSYCPKKFKTREAVAKHMKVHTEKPRPCAICGKMLKNARSLQYHVKYEHEFNGLQKPVVCQVCGKAFKTQFLHDRHTEIHKEQIKSFECEICHQKFREKYKLKTHMSIHTLERPFACDICNKTFRLKHLLDNHRNRHFPAEKVECFYCRKAVKYLDSHIQLKHRGLPKSAASIPSCTVCKEIFPSLEDLIVHVKIHKLEKRFECATCGMKYCYKSELKGHLQAVHLKLPNAKKEKSQCTLCWKTFSGVWNLKCHMNTHNSQKVFACEICTKSFKFENSLKRHMEEHETLVGNARKCFYCAEEFDDKRKLRIHVATNHRGLSINATEPPFKCTVCKENFQNFEGLKEHVSIHKEHCDICGKSFNLKSQAKAHAEKCHHKN
ncbi:zinc finger protein 26-like [Phlebotomus argentipes]|uniref:zinc finger protein 26-like n=1 Tax=Phlebotomus argentipes TaxID=94469 RepID=UPI0028932BF3|nr:zinc finger protein 26-like [Phlebotomus argentipes]